MSLQCEVCKTEMECLSGESAHRENWYCPNEDKHDKPKKCEVSEEEQRICIRAISRSGI